MSYIMDFEEISNVRSDDSVIEYEGFKMGKARLYLKITPSFRADKAF